MYRTNRNVAGDTFMTCKDCGHTISLDKICEKPIQSATDMLKHMAVHNASRAFAVAPSVIGPELETTLEIDPFTVPSAIPWITPNPQLPN